MGYGGGSGAARAMEAERQKRIDSGLADIDKQYATFDDGFYKKRATDYEDYALPQLGQELNDTRNNLTYNLARAGLLRSGAAIQKNAALDRTASQARRNVVDQAAATANSLRRDVEQNRGQVVAQLESSADPTASAQLANRSAAALNQPQTFQPIGSFFGDWSRNYLANQYARAADPAVPPLFSWGQTGSSREEKG